MTTPSLKIIFRCAAPDIPHALVTQQWSTDEEHCFHWGLDAMSHISEAGYIATGLHLREGITPRGVERSKEEALRAGRDTHAQFCKYPFTIRYDDVVYDPLDEER